MEQPKRRQPVSEDQVFAACEKLSEADKPVSVNAVLEETGGSFTTVGPMVRKWKNEREKASSAIMTMPESVVDAMKKSVADIWQAASQMANEEVDRIKADANTRINQTIQENEEYESEVRRLETVLDEAQREVEKANTKVEVSEKLTSTLQTEKAALETRLADREEELSRQRDQVSRLEDKLDRLQAELVEIAKKSADKDKSGD